jgi:hypothetical protein
MIRDRDRVYDAVVTRRLRAMGRGRTWRWIRMRPFLAWFSEPVWSRAILGGLHHHYDRV